MTTNNATNTTLSSQTGSGTFAGSTSPTIITPVIAQINDPSGHPALGMVTSFSNAVNFIQIYNAPAASAPEIQANGTDTDITILHRPKNGGVHIFVSASATIPHTWFAGTSGQHITQWQMGTSSATRTVTIPDLTGTLLMAGQAFSNISFRVLTSTSTVAYVPTTGTKFAIFDVMGSGGSGGGMGATGSGQGAATGGGGGGGYWRLYATAANMAGGVSYSVGVGGAAPAASFINGNQGTTTILTISAGTAWQAGGGFGGSAGGGVAPFGQTPGGAGGGLAAGTNATAIYGGSGCNAQDGILLSATAYNMGGHGGCGLYGMGAGLGGYSGTSAAVGAPGRSYGAGGGGSSSINFGGALSAGAGANGVIIVMEFIGT